MTRSWFVPDTGMGDRVFIRDEQFAWLPGTVIQTDFDGDNTGGPRAQVSIDIPDDWKLTTTRGQGDVAVKRKRWVSLKDYPKHQLPLQNQGVARDMAELPNLHEAAILYQVKARHGLQKPYTRVSEIVIAVNPCEWIPDLYSKEQQRMYAENVVWKALVQDTGAEEKKDDSNLTASSTSFASSFDRLGFEPHIYEASALAYRGLVQDRKDQTILVSGESGAGKTETVKIVLQHLATMENSAPEQKSSSKSRRRMPASDDLVRHIVESSSLFEAFGNAKTFSNNNSSRFGKVTQLQFDSQMQGVCGLQGSTCETCLLETSRVVSHVVGERNFHIFYQLLAAPSMIKADLMGMEWADVTVADFNFLNQSGDAQLTRVLDAETWICTRESLEMFNWKGESLRTLARSLGIILRLGNLSFSETDDGKAKISSRKELDILAESFGVSSEEIETAMTRRVINTAQEEVEVPLSAEAAKDACDAFIKRMYSVLFESVVRRVNFLTNAPASLEIQGTVSLVDIFGFENFEVNRFEQLCINYVNEKMQQKYVQDNLRRFTAEYKEEGIELFDYKLVDNSEILTLFEGRNGVINSLNEESVRPCGSNEVFVSKIKLIHESNDRLISEKLQSKTEFGIFHFAGPVTYDATIFMERNNDKLQESLIHLAAKSSNSLVSSQFNRILEERVAKEGTPNVVRKKAVSKTVLENFRNQLRKLMASMEGSQMRYIRCIKPNETMTPKVTEHLSVLRQLKSAGVVTATDLSRETFPNKLTYQQAKERFLCLMGEDFLHNTRDMELHDRVQLMISNLFAPLIQGYGDVNFSMPFACGKTRVYFRSGGLETLEAQRHEHYSKRAAVIQQWSRKVRMDQTYGQLRRATTRMQAMQRTYLVRKHYHRMRAAAVSLQAWTRCSSEQSRFLTTKWATVVLQTWARFQLAQELVIQEFVNQKARKIQIWWRDRVKTIRQRELSANQSASKIQIWWRVVSQCKAEARRQRELQKFYAVQAWWQEKENTAVLIIQLWFRARHEHTRSQRQANAASMIQRWYAKKSTLTLEERAEFEHIRFAALFIQAWYRKIVDQKAEERKQRVKDQEALAEIQNYWKPSIIRVEQEPTLPMICVDEESILPVMNADQEPTALTVYREDYNSRQNSKGIHQYEVEITSLKDEIQQVTREAEFHLQEVQADFEDKLIDYEDEVLELNQSIRVIQQEKLSLQGEIDCSQQGYVTKIQSLRRGMQKTHDSHKEYLSKVMGVLEEASEARKVETERITAELKAVKKEKDKRIQALEEELDILRKIGLEAEKADDTRNSVPTGVMPVVVTATNDSDMKMRRIAEKLEELLSPENILEVVSAAQRQPGTTVPYIEKKLAAKCRKFIASISAPSPADANIDENPTDAKTERRKIKELTQQLVLAQEEINRLQQQAAKSSTSSKTGARKGLFKSLPSSKAKDP